jgi:hypothetical protein
MQWKNKGFSETSGTSNSQSGIKTVKQNSQENHPACGGMNWEWTQLLSHVRK